MIKGLESKIPVDNPERELTQNGFPQGSKKCICELCTCGKHHCPRPKIRGIFQTTYKHDYVPYKRMPRGPYFCPALPSVKHYDQQSLVTSYDEYNKTSEMIIRENQSNHGSRNPRHRKSVFQNLANNILHNPARFAGMSEYKDSFKNPPRRQKSAIFSHSLDTLPPVRFEGESSYKHDYVPYLRKPVNFRTLDEVKVNIALPNPKSGCAAEPKLGISPSISVGDRMRTKTVPNQQTRICPCQLMPIPTTNDSGHVHIKYDVQAGEWV